MSNRNSNAGTASDSSTSDEVKTSSQTIAKPRVSRGEFYLIKNREKMPIVINNRVHAIRQILLNSKSTTRAFRELRLLFEKTKVQIGEYWTPDGRKRHLFIRNGFKGKAHFLIERK